MNLVLDGFSAFDFCEKLQNIGVKTLIVTDISKDGAMQGTNLNLYRDLSARFSMNLIASGGVSSIEDIRGLRELGMSGAILGRAYYSGSVRLGDALLAAGEGNMG